MTCINIFDLTTTDSELSTGVDSFLNELQKTETTQIFGGSRKKGNGYRYKKDNYSCYYEEKSDDSCYYEKKDDYKKNNGWKKEC